MVAIVLFAGARGTGNVSLFNGTALATAAVSIGFTGMVALGGTFFAIRLSRRARETVHKAGDRDEQQLGERRDDNEPEL